MWHSMCTWYMVNKSKVCIIQICSLAVNCSIVLSWIFGTLRNGQDKMAKFIAQMIVLGGQAISRAFRQALRQEYQATMAARQEAEKAGRSGTNAAKASALTGMSLQEAKQVLSIKDVEDVEIIRKNYNHLFQANKKSHGGSFYIQSKVVRAKERLEMELNQDIASSEEHEPSEPGSGDTDSSDQNTKT